MSALPKPLKFFASLRLAVVIIMGIAVLTAAGTFIEARFDAEVAEKLVYKAWPMYLVLGTLSLCLIAVMIDRLPWKRHHAGFVMAHIGILITLLGSVITQKYGVDGSMVFEIGQARKYVAIKDKDLAVYSSFDGNDVRPVYQDEVNFISRPPTEAKPFVVDIGQDKIEVVEYVHFAFRESEMKVSNRPMDGPALRFQLENPNVNLTEWLRKDSQRPAAEVNLGPARVVLTTSTPVPSGANEIFVRPIDTKKDSKFVQVEIYDKSKARKVSRRVQQGDTIETGWMGLKFRVLRFLPMAREEISYTKANGSSPLAQPAIRLRFKNEFYWLGMNSLMRLYHEQQMFMVSYGQRQLELPFSLTLKAFHMGKYQGTQRASSYASDVEVPGRGHVNISMNEPLYHGGFTFYQSSFEQDEMGKPTASILSVNYDPGRWLKYFGSLLIVLGSIVLFYFKRLEWRRRGSHVQ